MVEMRIWGAELLAGDKIAVSTTFGMEVYEAAVAAADTSNFCVTYERIDGTRGNVAADERLWVRR